MRWDNLVPDLRRESLFGLSLAQLRLAKAVSRGVANDCRAVLRSDRWRRVGENRFALEEEVKTRPLHKYKLPFTVSFFQNELEDERMLTATVHRLEIARIDEDGKRRDLREPGIWSSEQLKKIDCVISDMCVDVHGHGIVGSEASLRQLVKDHMLAWASRRSLGEKVWPYTVHNWGSHEYRIDGSDDDVRNEMPLYELLCNICLVTNVGANAWVTNQSPHSNQGGRGEMFVTVAILLEEGDPLCFA